MTAFSIFLFIALGFSLKTPTIRTVDLLCLYPISTTFYQNLVFLLPYPCFHFTFYYALCLFALLFLLGCFHFCNNFSLFYNSFLSLSSLLKNLPFSSYLIFSFLSSDTYGYFLALSYFYHPSTCLELFGRNACLFMACFHYL